MEFFCINTNIEFCIFFRVAFCFAKIRLSGVPLSLQPLPSLRSVQWPPLVPLLSLPRFVNQILEIEPNIYILHTVYNYKSVAGAYCLVSPVTSKIRIRRLWAGFFLQEVFVLRASLL